MRRELRVPYGQGAQRFSIEERVLSAVVLPRSGGAVSGRNPIAEALDSPLGATDIGDFLSPGRKTLVIVNDGTRPTPTPKVLEEIWPLLRRTEFRFMIACGTHKGPTREELGRIFGGHLGEADGRTLVHDSKASPMVEVGVTRRGNRLLVNSAFDEHERILVIGSVEPHYFAGFTGGRKGFLPGISAYETIERNHRNALDPESQILRLDGNPVHEEMAEMEAALKARKPDGIYSVQSIATGGAVAHAACGDITESFRALIPRALDTFCSPVPRRTGLVVTSAVPPGDATLYQAQKAAEHAKPALAKGGTVILVAECRDGIGPSAFFDLMASAPTPEEVISKIAGGYRLGYHKAAKLVELVAAGGRVRLVSSIDGEVLAKGFIIGHRSLQEAVDAAMGEDGCDSCTVMPEGHNTVPTVAGEGGTSCGGKPAL